MRRTCDRCAEVAAAREAGAREFAEALLNESILLDYGSAVGREGPMEAFARWLAVTAKKEGE